MPLAVLFLSSPMAGFPNVHSAYYLAFSVQFSYPSHTLISASQINFQMWVSDFPRFVTFPSWSLTFFRPFVWFGSLPSVSTDPKSAVICDFHMLFSPLYRSLMKRLNKTRSAPHSRATQRGGGAEELPVHQPVAQEGCKVMQQPSARRLLSRVHGHLSPPFVYDFSARFQGPESVVTSKPTYSALPGSP